MDFFGFGSSADFSTPAGVLVKAATDSFLVSPDWSKNLDICDLVSSTGEGPDHTAKAIMRRLGDSDPKVVGLALVVAETCMKNCGQRFAGAITQSFMDELVAVGRGRSGAHNQEEALRIVQQWGRAFEQKRSTFPIFFETFMSLKAKNVRFPPEEAGITPGFETKRTVPAPAPAPASAGRSREDHSVPATQSKDSSKLERDLTTVYEKVRLCQEMLLESPGIEEDEALSEVVGFLEACRDRMIDIIEAGSMGLLSEDLFAMVLKVNDSILRTLEAERTGQKIEIEEIGTSQSAPSSSSAAAASSSSQSVDLLDVFGGSSAAPLPAPSPAPPARPKAATTMLAEDDDEFGALTMKKPNVSGKPIKKLAPPPSGPSRAIQVESSSSAAPALTVDVFGSGVVEPVLVPLPAPAPVPAPAPSWSELLAPVPPPAAPLVASNNPFDAPLSSPPVAAQPPPASSVTNDIDLLFTGITPAQAATSVTPAQGGSVSSEQMTDADFDAFLTGLKS